MTLVQQPLNEHWISQPQSWFLRRGVSTIRTSTRLSSNASKYVDEATKRSRRVKVDRNFFPQRKWISVLLPCAFNHQKTKKESGRHKILYILFLYQYVVCRSQTISSWVYPCNFFVKCFGLRKKKKEGQFFCQLESSHVFNHYYYCFFCQMWKSWLIGNRG